MTTCAHTNFQQGQHVVVFLKSGVRFSDRFVENRSRHIVLKERGKVDKRLLRQVIIERATP